MRSWRVWKCLAIAALGACPFATVSSCDYGPGGGYLVYDQGVGFYPDYGDAVIIDDGYYYDDYYYDDGYYVDDCCGDYYYYDDDDD